MQILPIKKDVPEFVNNLEFKTRVLSEFQIFILLQHNGDQGKNMYFNEFLCKHNK